MSSTIKGRGFLHDCFSCNEAIVTHFYVSDKEWEEAVPEKMQKKVLCWRCYAKFRKEKGLKALKYEECAR